MNESDLKRFASQLFSWSELIIEHGRTPFRRVDLFPRLNTRIGSFQPPLVFWINRKSLMAAGVILLPDNDLPQQMAIGCATAEALGLQHFVTWESVQIRIWRVTGTTAHEEKRIPVVASDDPENFRTLLLDVMEQLKLLSVLGMVPPAELSPSYLHNLFQETLDSAIGPLITSFREARAEGGLHESTRADRQAEQLNRLTLLRLLALLWHDCLPDSILPEKLERAIELALPSLPPELHQPLAFQQTKQETGLPLDSAVCYHHLQIRLRQIRWAEPQERAIQAINLLLDPAEESCKPPTTSDSSEPVLQINPDRPQLGQIPLHELSDSAAFLAASALLRHVNNLPVAEQYLGNMFTFTAPPLPAKKVRAKLVNRRKIPRDERHRYDALLRTSWPTRRFSFANNTPSWVLETVHLLGLCPLETDLQLEVPLSWLSEPFGKTLWELIFETFHLQKVSLGRGTTRLQLLKQRPVSVATTISSRTEERMIDWTDHPDGHRSLLTLALLLPPEQYSLLHSDRFQPCSEATTSTGAGLLAYSRSSLGQNLWTLLGGNQTPTTIQELKQEGIKLAWPVPEENILYELGLPDKDGKVKLDSVDELDQLLASLLGSSVSIITSCPPLPALPGTTHVADKASPRNVKDEIKHHLDGFGLPDFPEQYLYQLDAPQLANYRFQPPLNIVSELLGEFELMDVTQKRFSIHGNATMEALILCSDQGRTDVELPTDQQQLNEILSAYRHDLGRLRQELSRQAHTRVESPQAAQRLAKKLWQELGLPPWKWLDHPLT